MLIRLIGVQLSSGSEKQATWNVYNSEAVKWIEEAAVERKKQDK